MSEWKFRRDTSFRKQFFVPDSFAHPAKMDAQLLIKIVEEYTQVGETILDPMAGSGTMMLACTLGRNCVLVELEDKFCKMMRDNWEEVKMRPQLGSQMGNCQIIQGDARQLGGLVDKIVTSPPYAKQIHPTHETEEKDGVIDKIVTSPPYEAGTSGPSRSPFWERLANDPTSARYGRQKHPSVGQGYDSIITSPPWEGTGFGQSNKYSGNVVNLNQQVVSRNRPSNIAKGQKARQIRYADQVESNIGNLKSDSYLFAMALVYSQCFSVLKPQGLMILVTKNFIRNKQIVRLDTDTIKLCEQAGFSYLERHYRKLPAQSFWRIIYAQKHPEVEQILYEDILVFWK